MGLIRQKDFQKMSGSPVGSKTKEGGNAVGLVLDLKKLNSRLYQVCTQTDSQLNLL